MWNSKIKFLFFDEDLPKRSKVDEKSARDSERVKFCESSWVLTKEQQVTQSSQTASFACRKQGALGRDVIVSDYSIPRTVHDYAIPRALRGRISSRAGESAITQISQEAYFSPTFSHPQFQTQSQQTKTIDQSGDRHRVNFQALEARPKSSQGTIAMEPFSINDSATDQIDVQESTTMTELCRGMAGLYTDSASTDKAAVSKFSIPLQKHLNKTTFESSAQSQTSSTLITSRMFLTTPQTQVLSYFADTLVKCSGNSSRLPVFHRDSHQQMYSSKLKDNSSQSCNVMVPTKIELQKLQYQALGARPRTAVVPIQSRQLPYGDSSPICNFCKRNGEPPAYYTSHNLEECGRITCPVLRRYVCPLCGATEDEAHTISYCPLWRGNSPTSVIRTRRQACGCKKGQCKHVKENSK